MGHGGFKQLRKELDETRYSSKDIKKTLIECETCARCVKKKHGPNKEKNVQHLGEYINADIMGPIQDKYALVAREGASGYIIGEITNSRQAISDVLINILKRFKNQLHLKNLSIINVRTDNEFKTEKMATSCKELGIE